jgi:signal transduction histidine kinase
LPGFPETPFLHPVSIQGGVEMKRFFLPAIIYTSILLALWTGYHLITQQAISRSQRENTILAADNLTQQISAEFKQMNTIASVIASSDFVQDFLSEQNIIAYYEKAAMASEIVRRAAFPISSADSVITISNDGRFYRFSGGLSSKSLETLYETFKDAETIYTVIELDGTLYFCHSVPAIDYSGRLPIRHGNVIMLTGRDKPRRMLGYGDGIDRGIIFSDTVLLSNNPGLEGMVAADLEPLYGVFSIAPIEGTSLTVVAAILSDALFPERRLFYTITALAICLLISIIYVIYRFLSSQIKLFDAVIARKNMRLNLLASQMDAHFIVNTLKSVKFLSDHRETEKAGQMAEGLAAILQHLHAGDALVNIFDDLQILEKYIGIMNIKFNEKFIVEYDVDDNLEACLMPGLILQPIVENALVHGLSGKEQEARLTVKGFMQDGDIFFEISDNGVGITPAKLKEIQDSLAQPEFDDFPPPGLRGVALTNIQRRIHISSGDRYGIAVTSCEGAGTMETVRLPAVSDK